MKKSIIASSNRTSRTFTIRKYEVAKCYAKFKTLPMSRQEFEDMEYWTQGDWEYYLKSEQSYWRLK
jgi:hypothetical protein